MFSSQKLKIKLVYMGFGGMIAIIGMLFGIGLLSSVTAQKDMFDTIQCTRLEVVDEDGMPRVILSADYSDVMPFGRDEETRGRIIGTKSLGGWVFVYGKDGQTGARVGVHQVLGLGDVIAVFDNDGNTIAGLGFGEHGGWLGVSDGDDKSHAGLAIDEHGGQVQAFGRGKGKAAMGINEHGTGAMSTWDKYGYRQ